MGGVGVGRGEWMVDGGEGGTGAVGGLWVAG